MEGYTFPGSNGPRRIVESFRNLVKDFNLAEIVCQTARLP
jgi:hypothetical protein